MIRSKTIKASRTGRHSVPPESFGETIITEIGELRPGKGRNNLKRVISDALKQLSNFAERIPARSRWRRIGSNARAASRALDPLIKRVRGLNEELVADDQKYKREKKSGPTHPVFYDSELKHLSGLAAKLDRHAALTTGRDPRMDELKYECAQKAYAVMIEYSNEKPNRTREGKFQIIAGHFFAAVENSNGGNAVSMARACNRVLDERT